MRRKQKDENKEVLQEEKDYGLHFDEKRFLERREEYQVLYLQSKKKKISRVQM